MPLNSAAFRFSLSPCGPPLRAAGRRYPLLFGQRCGAFVHRPLISSRYPSPARATCQTPGDTRHPAANVALLPVYCVVHCLNIGFPIHVQTIWRNSFSAGRRRQRPVSSREPFSRAAIRRARQAGIRSASAFQRRHRHCARGGEDGCREFVRGLGINIRRIRAARSPAGAG